MKLKLYPKQLETWPEQGQHILAQYTDEKIVVYQSYRPEIGNFAVQNQFFGGAFSLDRMTWIKPNFLWMMYRNGWGTKMGQEVVLAIHLKMDAFKRYLEHATHTSYQSDIYETRDIWRMQLNASDVRLQWDPDHDPYGNKVSRRAIQIGLKGEQIAQYAKEDIIKIEDISDFVATQYQYVKSNQIDKLVLPEEKPLIFDAEVFNLKIGINR